MFGVDIDSKSELKLLITYLNASALGKTTVDATKHGYHDRVFKECSYEKAVQARTLLNDDKNRMAFEEKEILDGIEDWRDTLFKGKLKEERKWTFEEPVYNLLALPFWSSGRARKLVNRNDVRKYANAKKRRRKEKRDEDEPTKRYDPFDYDNLLKYFIQNLEGDSKKWLEDTLRNQIKNRKKLGARKRIRIEREKEKMKKDRGVTNGRK